MKNEVNLLNSDIRIPTLESCYCLHLFIYPSMHAGEREKQEEYQESILATPVPAHLDEWTNGWIC